MSDVTNTLVHDIKLDICNCSITFEVNETGQDNNRIFYLDDADQYESILDQVVQFWREGEIDIAGSYKRVLQENFARLLEYEYITEQS